MPELDFFLNVIRQDAIKDGLSYGNAAPRPDGFLHRLHCPGYAWRAELLPGLLDLDKERRLAGCGSQSQKHDGRPGRAGQTDRCGNHAQGQQDFIPQHGCPHGCVGGREFPKLRWIQ